MGGTAPSRTPAGNAEARVVLEDEERLLGKSLRGRGRGEEVFNILGGMGVLPMVWSRGGVEIRPVLGSRTGGDGTGGGLGSCCCCCCCCCCWSDSGERTGQ